MVDSILVDVPYADAITVELATPKTTTGTQVSTIARSCDDIRQFASTVRGSAERTLNVAIRSGSAGLTNESVQTLMCLGKGAKLVGGAHSLLKAAFGVEAKAHRLEASAGKLATFALDGKDLAADPMPKLGKNGETYSLQSLSLGTIALHGYQFSPLAGRMPKQGIATARGPLESVAITLWLHQFIDTAEVESDEVFTVTKTKPAQEIEDGKTVINGEVTHFSFTFVNDAAIAKTTKWEIDLSGEAIAPTTKVKAGPRTL